MTIITDGAWMSVRGIMERDASTGCSSNNGCVVTAAAAAAAADFRLVSANLVVIISCPARRPVAATLIVSVK